MAVESRHERTAARRRARAPRRVLVVEDEPTIAVSVAHRLRAEGYEVEVAGDGPSAVQPP